MSLILTHTHRRTTVSKRFTHFSCHVAVSLLVSGAMNCSAADFSVNGFASLGIGKTLGEDERFTANLSRGGVYDNELSFRPDTIFGFQVTTDLGDGLEARVQTTADANLGFDPTFEWAYLSYELSKHSTIHLGRKRAPIFMYSDSLDVGYTYQWVRPPTDFYSSLIDNYEGLSFLYKRPVGNWFLTSQIGYGRNQDEIELFSNLPSQKIDSQDIVTIDARLSLDWLTLRAGHYSSTTSAPKLSQNDINAFLSRFIVTAGPQQIDLLANLSEEEKLGLLVQDVKFEFNSLGLSLDKANVIVVAEFAKADFSFSRIDPFEAYYYTLGYRIKGVLTPSFTYSKVKDDPGAHDVVGRLGPLPAPAVAAVNGFLGTDLDRKSQIFSLRYDFHNAAALKLEYVHQENDAPGGLKSESFVAAVDIAF